MNRYDKDPLYDEESRNRYDAQSSRRRPDQDRSFAPTGGGGWYDDHEGRTMESGGGASRFGGVDPDGYERARERGDYRRSRDSENFYQAQRGPQDLNRDDYYSGSTGGYFDDRPSRTGYGHSQNRSAGKRGYDLDPGADRLLEEGYRRDHFEGGSRDDLYRQSESRFDRDRAQPDRMSERGRDRAARSDFTDRPESAWVGSEFRDRQRGGNDRFGNQDSPWRQDEYWSERSRNRR